MYPHILVAFADVGRQAENFAQVESTEVLSKERISTMGTKFLVRSLPDWFKLCVYADVKSVVGTEGVA